MQVIAFDNYEYHSHHILIFMLSHKVHFSRIHLNLLTLGMVSVCAGCDAYYPWTALFLGCTAGFLHLLGSLLLVRLKIDDPLDAAPIHFLCGK